MKWLKIGEMGFAVEDVDKDDWGNVIFDKELVKCKAAKKVNKYHRVIVVDVKNDIVEFSETEAEFSFFPTKKYTQIAKSYVAETVGVGGETHVLYTVPDGYTLFIDAISLFARYVAADGNADIHVRDTNEDIQYRPLFLRIDSVTTTLSDTLSIPKGLRVPTGFDVCLKVDEVILYAGFIHGWLEED